MQFGTNLRLERGLLTTLGLLAACPDSSAMTTSASASGTTAGGGETTTGTTGTTGDAPTGATGDPTTAPSSTTDPTSTTGPAPECVDDVDCIDACFCIDGSCVPCHEPYDEYCYDDDECADDEECLLGECTPVENECDGSEDCLDGYDCSGGLCIPTPPSGPKQLPLCVKTAVDHKSWDLSRIPSAIILADVDGDGDLDAVTAHPKVSATLGLAFNDGTGVFSTSPSIDLEPADTNMQLAAGDFDGDGDVDIAVSRVKNSDVLLVLNQDGMFTQGPSRPAAEPPRTIRALDADDDGDLDVMTVGGDFDRVSAFLGDGAGGLAPELQIISSGALKFTVTPSIGGDVRPELLAVPADGTTLMKIYRGEPDLKWVVDQQFDLGAPLWSAVVTGDFGASTFAELIAVDVDREVRIWRGIGELAWATEPQIYKTESGLTFGLLGDVNGDGFTDTIHSTGTETITALYGDGVGGLSCERTRVTVARTEGGLYAVGELDGDVGDEVVIASEDDFTVMVFDAL